MDKQIYFTNEGLEEHLCRSWQEGEWLIFQCPDCGFARKLNWHTAELVLLNAGNSKALHSGAHAPVQGLAGLESSN